jgi:peptidoglycan/xylan/chitin deacetylase (PgdA/CDA1 family)
MALPETRTSILQRLPRRFLGAWRNTAMRRFATRISVKTDPRPFVSFTFDDFPVSALENAGPILLEHGARGTYYVSLGLLGRDSPSGALAGPDELRRLASAGHELGCHTLDHLDGWATNAKQLLESIDANRRAAQSIVPGVQLQTFAYPVNGPRVGTKRAIGARFLCCRGGGQYANPRHVDFNYVRSFFLDARAGYDLAPVRDLVERNRRAGGWLVFATHDVRDEPSRYGCSTAFFREVVSCCVRSGAVLLTVARACIAISGDHA